jgi:uncharacterized repeat protein (TIGR04076 family)
MFKVKATVTGFGKDESKDPCHFRYKVGDEISFDGEQMVGRICPNMLPQFGKAFRDLFASGGRHKEGENAASYYPFFHSPRSVYDPAYKKYDGVGFRPTLERSAEGYKFVADETLFDTPPGGKFIIGNGKEKRDFTLVCGDNHTLVQFKLEAFDMADRGDALPYYRRAMTILSKISGKPGIAMNKIINEFTKEERDNIYPSFGQRMVAVIVGELELLNFIDSKENKVTITDKGKKKLAGFIKTLSAEEKKALKL